jgi:hypothetical protein
MKQREEERKRRRNRRRKRGRKQKERGKEICLLRREHYSNQSVFVICTGYSP